jgi:heme exporter protein B
VKRLLLLAGNDLVSEVRGKQIVLVMVLFAVSLVFLLTFALPTGSLRSPLPPPQAGAVAAREIMGTLIWATIFFASVIGLGRGVSVDLQSGAREALVLAPVDPASLFVGKMIANLAFLLATEIAVIPLFVVFGNIDAGLLFPGIVGVALAADLGLAAIGTLFGTASQYSEARSVMLPLLLFPFALPVVLAASRLTSALLIQGSMGGEVRWFILMAVFDVVFVTIGAVTFEFVIQE